MVASTVYSLLCKKENAHEDPIYCCAWAKIKPSGDTNEKVSNYLVTAGLDGVAKVWQVKNNRLHLLHVLKGHCMAIVSVAISPDGYTLATTSLDSILIIWELSTGYKVHEIENGSTDTWKVVFSPDGCKVVSGSHTGKLIIYDVEKKHVLKVLDTRGKFALCVAWSRDGKLIGSGSVDGNVCIFDEAQGKLIHTVEAHTEVVRSIEFSQSNRLLATVSNDGFIKLLNVDSGDIQCSLHLKQWVLSVSFSPDGTRIAAGTSDGTVVIVSTAGLKILKIFQEHNNIVWGVQFNENSEKLVSVSKDKCINIYECPKLKPNKN